MIAFGDALAFGHTYNQNGLTWSSGTLRMNQIQVVGTHNSYHLEALPADQQTMLALRPDLQNVFYSHPALDVQASFQSVRSFELDIFADPDGGGHYATPWIRRNKSTEPIPELQGPGIKILHIADIDYNATCHTLKSCLQVVKSWSDAHTDHVPIPIMIEFKTSEEILIALGGSKPISWANTKLLDGLDAEIRSVFSSKQLIVPDDIRRDDLSLEQSVLTHGWPDLDSARGRVFFLMDNGPVHVVRDAYIKDRPNLEGRIIFTNSAPGNSDCAFQKLNDPTGDNQVNIQEQVKAGYWVRTRADEPLSTLFTHNVTARREAAFSSGAQIVSTDFQAYGMSSRWGVDYAVTLPGGRSARCNPVNVVGKCADQRLEREEYRR
ncbi:acid phosphatase [Mariannaea sp. PMI_226]|nr:acid phosphatase [Mariannaea sp. PMI_226]